VLRTVPLTTKLGGTAESKQGWTFDPAALRKAFTKQTRVFILNNPHNPTGHVFTLEEMNAILAILKDFPDVVVVSDEVYEHIVYDGTKHYHTAALPGMWDRTITVSSAGKTFSMTGWKIGWAIAPEHLIRCVAVSHQWVAFSVNSPCQEAIARALVEAEKPYKGKSSYYEWLLGEYTRKRKLICDALQAVGIEPIWPRGSFFVLGDTRNVKVPDKYLADKTVTRDWALCRWLTVDIGVAAIPPASFYCDANKHMAQNHARFAFCKPDEVLEEAAKRLLKVKEQVDPNLLKKA